jgi:hypothetical protein
MTKRLAMLMGILLLTDGGISAGGGDPTEPALRYSVSATKARRNRRVLAEPVTDIRGVPAEPVNSFCWDGIGSTPIQGRIVIDVDPVANTGSIEARWMDEHGLWTYRQDTFVHPHHSSGAFVGRTVSEVEQVLLDSITTNVYLHGDTTAGLPVLPTVFTYLAAWGPADVTLNGEPFLNPFDSPFLPQWEGHLMVTNGVRDEDGTVRTFDGLIYDPTQGSNGWADPEDVECHLTWHDQRFPLTSNVPPLFEFFYHLVFEDVLIQVRHVEPPPEK